MGCAHVAMEGLRELVALDLALAGIAGGGGRAGTRGGREN